MFILLYKTYSRYEFIKQIVTEDKIDDDQKYNLNIGMTRQVFICVSKYRPKSHEQSRTN